MQKEKELAERRKNDPALNTSQDHLVRKLFSKFKKTSGGDLTSPHGVAAKSAAGASKDVEHGGGSRLQAPQGKNI